MGLLEIAKETLKEIPMADVLRERLSLALDQSADFQRQLSTTAALQAKLEAQLEIVTLDRNKAREELQRLKDEHSEEIRIKHGIEFRKGKRTGGDWIAFCPKCHLPAADSEDHSVVECSAFCGWQVSPPSSMYQVAKSL